MVAGNNAALYTSVDDGETFSKAGVDSEYEGDFTLLYYDRNEYSLFGQQATYTIRQKSERSTRSARESMT